jgi:LacI family transcriptional regulator
MTMRNTQVTHSVQGKIKTRSTIRDVAKLAGVDPSLVSRIVNSNPGANASVATRKRVLDAVIELGYRANTSARTLKTAKTQMIGVLLPDLSNPIYSSIINGVEKRCHELGYGILLGDHAEDSSERVFTSLLENSQVDGLLIASGTLPDSFLKRVVGEESSPIVMINRKVKGVPSSVTVNDALASIMAVEHLRTPGTRYLAGIFGPGNIDTAKRRRIGFESACKSAGLENKIIERTSWGLSAGYEAGLKIFRQRRIPDGIFASTIMMGIGILRAASEIGIGVPNQTRIVAMHDSDIAKYITPTLTTIKMPTDEMGAQSVDLLLRLFDGGKPSHIVVENSPQLIIRESSVFK